MVYQWLIICLYVIIWHETKMAPVIISFLLILYMYIYVYVRLVRSMWMQWVGDMTEVYINDISCVCNGKKSIVDAIGRSLY